jgi:L-alanine-DL-glutamate epimerase-like enolase superfamily enzyme
MGDEIRFRVIEAEAFLRDCTTRLPFRFGVVTMRGAPLCVLRVTVECDDGARATGYASDLLVPRWFEKTPGQTVEQDWTRLIENISGACVDVLGHPADSAFGHWDRLDAGRVMAWTGARSTRLMIGQGVSLVERALIDAVCRKTGRPFHACVLGGVLGFPDRPLAGLPSLAEAVPQRPLDAVHVRHTVGLVDAIREADAPADAPDDGAPVSLEGAVVRHGLTHFKLKVSGDDAADADRLARIARVLRERCPGDPVCTLDGNEQYGSIDALASLLARLDATDDLRFLRDRILYIEQPLSRAATFGVSPGELDRFGLPVIIDEADADRDCFREALGLGYQGVSVKNCKGVFRAALNAVRCAGAGAFQSAEDLTNIPIVALQQDLATSAFLGLGHIERNGHHYFAGLAHLDGRDRDAALARHPDLYEAGDPPRVAIEGGRLRIGSLHGTRGYGFDGELDLDGWAPIGAWSPGPLLEATGGGGA